MTFINPSIIKLQVVGGNNNEFTQSFTAGGALTLSDHSRSPLSIDYDMIQKESRMADGTLRKYVVAKKKVFSCSWSLIPTIQSFIVDSHADAKTMKDFYEKYCYAPMNLSLKHHRNSSNTESYFEEYTVFWSSFNYEIIKRYKDFDYWDVTAEFMEV